MITRTVIRFVVVAVVIFFLPNIVPGISVAAPTDAVVVAVVLALLNIFLKPVLRLASFPIRLLTLGLFSLVINGALLWLAGQVVAGFTITGFPEALVGALIISVVSLFARRLGAGKKK